MLSLRAIKPEGTNSRAAVPLLPAAALLASTTAVAAILLRFPPDRYPIYPRCPIYTYFHLLCPGCGTTRALAALLHGNLLEALHLNPLSTLLLPIAVLYAAHHYWQQRSGPTQGWPYLPNYATYTLLTITAIFAITRNLTT
jgi:1-acyl-sn-glycerol-3-phosphate acyltransferase